MGNGSKQRNLPMTHTPRHYRHHPVRPHPVRSIPMNQIESATTVQHPPIRRNNAVINLKKPRGRIHCRVKRNNRIHPVHLPPQPRRRRPILPLQRDRINVHKPNEAYLGRFNICFMILPEYKHLNERCNDVLLLTVS